jgi:hypothetical protein
MEEERGGPSHVYERRRACLIGLGPTAPHTAFPSMAGRGIPLKCGAPGVKGTKRPPSATLMGRGEKAVGGVGHSDDAADDRILHRTLVVG